MKLELIFLVFFTSEFAFANNDSSFSEFSRSNLVVWFEPYVSITDIEDSFPYDVSGLIPMITKISTKFSKLMMPCISRAEKETDSRVGIPSAVATFNKLHRNPQQPPLELLMTFTYFYMYSGNESISFIFDFSKELADRANEIYNGTVKWLYFDYDSLSDNTIEEAHTYLAHAQNILNRNGYEVGAVLPMDNCGGSSEILANYTLRILPLVRKIIFHFWPTQQSLSLGPDTAVPHLTKSFVQCIETIRKYDSSLQVGFQTRWDNPSPNADEDEAKNYRDLVQFWQKMNAWAIEYNTTVVLLEAFDNPWKYDGNKNLGWWRLIQNASYYNSSQYVFQEKQIAISNRKIPTDADATLIFRVVLGTTSALVFFTLLALVALYRPLRKRFSKDRVRSKYLREFYEGAPETLIEGDTKGIPGIQRTAYRKDLELPKAAFKIDWKSTLGTGAFGAVCRGAIKRVNDEKEIQVAVKTTKLSSPVTALKSILSEIKVMSYVDKHSNIVGLLGAYTTELKKGKVYVFLELCSLGSLDKYLREKGKALYCELKNEEEIPASNQEMIAQYSESEITINGVETVKKSQSNEDEDVIDEYESVSLYEVVQSEDNAKADTESESVPFALDLYRWSYEIASGMEFLASKKVVHADLATRNVLLTHDKIAKISDFGLSRRLYEYTNYMKTGQEPLPWRWMAPEALRRMEFNEKTDVWSFGVTLWEIYSFGDLPFQGISWNPNFSSQLTKGLRLGEPSHNSNEMYSTMLRCWDVDPCKRPTFSDLTKILQ